MAHADESAGNYEGPSPRPVKGDCVILVTYAGQEPVGVAALRNLGPGIGEIKRMYVVPAHRGAGVAKELLEALEKRARERGLDAVRLDTHERLTETNGLYGSMGYREIDDYNGNASANRWFEKVLA